MNKRLNIIVKFYFNQKLKYNNKFNEQFENYKNKSAELKYMYFINDAEKEINKNNQLKNLDKMVNNFLVSKNKSSDILDYLNNAF